MKKLLIVASVAAAFGATTAAQAKVYGKATLSLNYNTETEAFTLDDDGSRVGFKGTEDLGNGLKGEYKLEVGTTDYSAGGASIKLVDKDAKEKSVKKNVFKVRHSYLGLGSDSMGTVLLGQMSTPLDNATNGVDVMRNIGAGTLTGDSRDGNTILYKSPALADMPLSFSASVTLDEDTSADNNIYRAHAGYESNGIYIGGATEQNDSKPDLYKVVGKLNMGGTQVGGAYQMVASETDGQDQNEFLVSVKHALAGTPVTLKGQFNMNDPEKGDSVNTFGVGAEYKFSKRTMAEVYAGQNAAEDTILGVGATHKF